MTDNPIHCNECVCEIDPEKIGLNAKEVDVIANWFRVEQSLYSLWIDSAEYETWAKEKLTDKNGQVLKMGLEAAAILSSKYPTYYCLFHDTDDEIPDRCPICNSNLDKKLPNYSQCESCKIRI
jgi:hypothetical protein